MKQMPVGRRVSTGDEHEVRHTLGLPGGKVTRDETGRTHRAQRHPLLAGRGEDHLQRVGERIERQVLLERGRQPCTAEVEIDDRQVAPKDVRSGPVRGTSQLSAIWLT